MALMRGAVIALLVAAACGGKDARGVGTESGRGRPGPESVSTASPTKPACARTGHWSECQVFARLEQAGVAPRREGTLKDLPAFPVAPQVYTIGSAKVAVYLFTDSLERARAARQLDTLHFVSPAASLTMRNEATAIQNDNLLALLYSLRDQQRERVSDAFQAGAPQP